MSYLISPIVTLNCGRYLALWSDHVADLGVRRDSFG